MIYKSISLNKQPIVAPLYLFEFSRPDWIVDLSGPKIGSRYNDDFQTFYGHHSLYRWHVILLLVRVFCWKLLLDWWFVWVIDLEICAFYFHFFLIRLYYAKEQATHNRSVRRTSFSINLFKTITYYYTTSIQ